MVQWPQSLPPISYSVSVPSVENLTFINSYIPSAVFDAPNIRTIKYSFSPEFDMWDTVDFWPDSEDLKPKPYPSLHRIELGDVLDSTLHGFSSAAQFLRAYSDVPVLHLRGKGIADLLCLSFGGGSDSPALITGPGMSRFTGLTPPPGLQKLVIDEWTVEEEEGTVPPEPAPPQNIKDLAEVLLELLTNSADLVISWSTLCDPTAPGMALQARVATGEEALRLQETVDEVRKAIEELLRRFPTRVRLHLA